MRRIKAIKLSVSQASWLRFLIFNFDQMFAYFVINRNATETRYTVYPSQHNDHLRQVTTRQLACSYSRTTIRYVVWVLYIYSDQLYYCLVWKKKKKQITWQLYCFYNVQFYGFCIFIKKLFSVNVHWNFDRVLIIWHIL